MEIPETWPPSLETCMQVKKQQLELEVEQQTGSKLEKVHIEAVHCHPAYSTYMQITSLEMLGWMKHKLQARFQGEISITWYADGTTLMAESEEEVKSLLMKKESEKLA